MTAGAKEEGGYADEPVRQEAHRVVLGDQTCPRCRKTFTVSYWSGQTLVQARCLSCDLRWPRPDVV